MVTITSAKKFRRNRSFNRTQNPASRKTKPMLHVYWMAHSVFWFIHCFSLLSSSRKPWVAIISVNLFFCALRIGSGVKQHRFCIDHQKSSKGKLKLEGRQGRPSEEELPGNYPPKGFPIKDSMVKEFKK